MSHLAGLCRNPLFSSAQSWNTSDPDVSVCLQKTALVLGPCGALWLAAPPYLVFLWRRQCGGEIKHTALNAVKTVLAAGLVLLAAGDTVLWSKVEHRSPADLLDPAVRIVTWIVLIVIVQVERIRGCRNSSFQWIFWLVYLICSIPRLYSQARRSASTDHRTAELDPSFDHHTAELVSTSLAFAMAGLSWILAFLVDHQPQYMGPDSASKSLKPSPELSASFPSNLLYSWFSSMCWRGFRQSVVAEDLWDLNPRDASATVVPKFNSFWEPQLKSAKLEQVTQPSVQACFDSHLDTTVVSPSTKSGLKDKLSVMMPLVKTFGLSFLCSSLLKLVHTILTFIPPLLLKKLIEFSGNDDPLWKGVVYAVLLFLATMAQTVVFTQFVYWMCLLGIWMKACLVSAIYRKSLTVTAKAKKSSSSGEVVNLMSVDCQRICDMTQSINLLWDVPIKVIVALWWLWQLLGPSVLAGVGMMILLVPINAILVFNMRKIQIQQMKTKDTRMKKMNELLRGIKILKLYAWENSFMEEVKKIRDEEIKLMKKMSYFFVGMYFIMSCTPFMVTLVTFGTYVLSSPENILDSTKAFTALSLFNIISFPLSFLPMVISGTVQAKVSVNRINEFMKNEELDPNNVEKSADASSDIAVEVEHASFQWELPEEGKEEPKIVKRRRKSRKADTKVEGETLLSDVNGSANQTGRSKGDGFGLKDISLKIPRGSLCAVVGSVGSGKSSLLSCLLGDMIKTSGRVELHGRVAYVAQQPWIQNSTLEQNILFDYSKDPAVYSKVLEDCALAPDLQMLPSGDQTEIGENGINLSGGQKQRVSLARAVYSRADVYLLDDPMSAVDSQVGKHLFERVIGPGGSLDSATRILVTHGLTYLPLVDQIIVLRDGRITETGTYKELVEQKGDFSEFLMQYLSEKEENEKEKMEEEDSEDELEPTDLGKEGRKKANTEKQYQEEKSATGHVSWRVYSLYFRNMGYCTLGWCVVFFAMFQVFKGMSAVWLTVWTDATDSRLNSNSTFNSNSIFNSNSTSKTNSNLSINSKLSSSSTFISNSSKSSDATHINFYLGVYGVWGVAQALMIMLATLLLYAGILSGAKKFHHNMLRSILRAPMTFFDTTPQGRIINRFGKDIDVLDSMLPRMFSMLLISIFNVTITILVIVGVVPMSAIPIFVVLLIYYGVQKVYVATSRQLKRLESVSRSPIYSHFGETVTGASTIRAYGLERRFIEESEKRVDENHKATYCSVICTRWLAIRLETIGNVIILAAALLAVIGRDTLSPGLVGLGVTYSLQVTMALNWFVRNVSDMEANIVAVERMQEYTDIRQEDSLIKEDLVDHQDDWPQHGHIRLDSYSLRYRDGLDLVLKDITADLTGGQRVGIVGRTGAGKSSLTLALFRLIEPAAGAITIDGVDICTLGLHQLRSRLTIIPQDPVLFSGSLRRNLDPFDTYPDERLTSALRQAHLLPYVQSLEAGLQHEVAEGGENMSVGQRQLVCLARALLRKTKVLVLDEATAAVDLETDDLIQQTIRSEFNGCTVITIAHRINTIVDYDQVMVLEEGRLVEMDSPAVLRAREGSIFRSMCQDAGI